MQTADGGLNETHAILQRMRTLAVQAANSGVMSKDDLRAIQVEMTQLTADIDRIAYGSDFNGMPLLDGSFYKKSLQVGANDGDTMGVSVFSGITPAIPPTPPTTLPPTPAGTALWDVNQNLASLANPVTVEQTVAGATATASISLPTPGPTTVSALVTLLNADPSFAAAFTAETGSYMTSPTDTGHQNVNLIIMSKTPGVGGEVTITGIGSSLKQVDLGSDEVTFPGQPGREERIRGFASVDIFSAPIDVTRLAGSSTIPGYTYTNDGGKNTGFGNGTYTGSTTITVPPTTTTWGSGADEAIGVIDRAIAIVSKGRTDIGAYQNRLEHTATSVSVSAENLAASESRIRDADMAREMSALAKDQIVAQAATAMTAQANQAPQAILKLLPNG